MKTVRRNMELITGCSVCLEEYLDSGTRHYMKHRRGDTDEPHLRASVWNFIGLVWTTLNRPELKYKTVPETLDDIKKKE